MLIDIEKILSALSETQITALGRMSKSGFLEQHFGRRNDSANLPAEYIQEHMEDDELKTAMITPPLQYVSRINSFATSEIARELER